MKTDFKVAFLVLTVFCQLCCVDGWLLWRSRRLPTVALKARCSLTSYYGSKFIGKTPRVHTGFLASMRKIDSFAQQCKVQVYVTSSYRSTTRVNGAIVTPAKISNHLIGHAIDMNLRDEATKKFCNSKCLGSSNKPSGVKCFIQKIRSNYPLRWGGDFVKTDLVHIDDGTNVNNRGLWDQIYKSVQKNCH